jgi:PAS domain S-box-containing protein
MADSDSSKDMVIAGLREQIDEMLARSRADNDWEFRSLLQSLSHAVLFVDAAGRIIMANKAAEKMMGVTLTDLMKRSVFDMPWKWKNPDLSDVPADSHPLVACIRKGEAVHDRVLGVPVPRTGRYRWYSVTALPRFTSSSPLPVEAFVILEDITARKDAEDKATGERTRYRELFENTNTCVAVFAPTPDSGNFIIKDLNKAALRLEKIGKEEIIGKFADEVFPGLRESGLR